MPTAGDDGITVLVAVVVVASVYAVAGWWLAARGAHDREVGATTRARSAYSGVGLVVVVVASVLGLVTAPVIGVFYLWLALNRLLGAAENVPFSTYPMFAEPSEKSWALRYELPDGAPLNVVKLGIQPPTARKRFSRELLSALAETNDRDVARRRAADVIAEWIRTRRPQSGPLATEPIAIVLMEYEFDGRTIATRRNVLTVVASP